MNFTRARSYHHGDLRGELIQRGEATLREAGVDGLSLRQLARDIGVSHGAPSRHFRDKQALLDAIALSGFERLGGVFAASVSEGAFEARLEAVARAYLRFATENPALLELMFARKHSPTGGVELPAAAERAFRMPIALIAEGQASGDLIEGDATQIGLAAFAGMQGLVTFVSSGFVSVELGERLIGELVAQTMNGLRPRD